MKYLFIPIIFFVTSNCFGQQIEKFYTYDWKETTMSYARFYALIEKKDSLWYRRDFYINEKKLQMEGYYRDSNCSIADGPFNFFHANGKISSYGFYVNGKRSGVWESYHSNGMMSDSCNYDQGKIVGTYLAWFPSGYLSDSAVYNADGSGVAISWFDNGNPSSAGRFKANRIPNGTWTFFHKNGKLSCKEIYDGGKEVSVSCMDENGNPVEALNVEKPATFPGGDLAWKKFMNKHLYFPNGLKLVNSDKIVVVVKATIDEEGKVIDPEIDVSFHPEFDRIALNVFKRSPDWEPAISHNRKVRYHITQAIYFTQKED